MLRSPVALFVYNRKTYLPSLLDRIRAAHPTKLYVFGDGPKDDPQDHMRCAEVRSLFTAVEWDFPVEIDFAPDNLGFNRRIVSGIDCVFAQEQRSLFLEDDVELSPSFFPYCDWLLDVYEDRDEVAMISGVNPLSDWPNAAANCLFSKRGNAQAWATWRRAWRFFPGAADLWHKPKVRAGVAGFLGDPEIFASCAVTYERLSNPLTSSWDVQWELARLARRTLCAVPTKNLAIHRGRGSMASNVKTRSVLDDIAAWHETAPPFRAPAIIAADAAFDRLHFEGTQNRLSQASARWLAERLMARGRNLLARAVLRHATKTSVPDAETQALIEEAIFRERRD